MRTCSTDLSNYLKSNGRTIRCKITIASETIESVTSVRMVTEWGSEITIGNTAASYIEVEMPLPTNTINFKGAEVTLYFGAEISGSIEYVKMGIFRIADDTLEKRNGKVKFTAYDRMYSNTQKIYNSTIPLPASMSAILSDICTQCSLTFSGSLGVNPQVNVDLSGFTCRDAIGYIAAYQAKNAMVDSNGSLVFKWFASTIYDVDEYHSNVPEADESDIEIKYIACNTGDSIIRSGNGPYGLNIANPLIDQTRLDAILTSILNFKYRRLTDSVPLGTILIEPGDIVTIHNTYTVPVMQIEINFDGGISNMLYSFGVNDGTESSISAKSMTYKAKFNQLQQAIADATEAITGNSGGYVVLYPSENPQEILIMDTDNKDTAVNVWRWNKTGLGFSHNGYLGPYETAITASGSIVANFITAGVLAGVIMRTLGTDSCTQLKQGAVEFYEGENGSFSLTNQTRIGAINTVKAADIGNFFLALGINSARAFRIYSINNTSGEYDSVKYQCHPGASSSDCCHTFFDGVGVDKLILAGYNVDSKITEIENRLVAIEDRLAAGGL